MTSAAITEAVGKLRTARQATVARTAMLPADALARPARWLGGDVELRFLLLRLADDDLDRALRLEQQLDDAGFRPTTVQRILRRAAALRGRLEGTLAGLTPEQFDQGFAEEWSVRRVLGHVIAIDERYLAQTRFSVERARAGGTGPERPPAGSIPEPHGLPESEGAMTDVLARLVATRDRLMSELAGLSDEDLQAETTWVAFRSRVNFRVRRFIEHDREHLGQLWKTFAGIGLPVTEPRVILEEAGAARGELEGLLVGIEAGSAAEAAALAVLQEAVEREAGLVEEIERAAGAAV